MPPLKLATGLSAEAWVNPAGVPLSYLNMVGDLPATEEIVIVPGTHSSFVAGETMLDLLFRQHDSNYSYQECDQSHIVRIGIDLVAPLDYAIAL